MSSRTSTSPTSRAISRTNGQAFHLHRSPPSADASRRMSILVADEQSSAVVLGDTSAARVCP